MPSLRPPLKPVISSTVQLLPRPIFETSWEKTEPVVGLNGPEPMTISSMQRPPGGKVTPCEAPAAPGVAAEAAWEAPAPAWAAALVGVDSDGMRVNSTPVPMKRGPTKRLGEDAFAGEIPEVDQPGPVPEPEPRRGGATGGEAAPLMEASGIRSNGPLSSRSLSPAAVATSSGNWKLLPRDLPETGRLLEPATSVRTAPWARQCPSGAACWN
mmetsp:Transcript_38638/g.84663  ORF Transcript_38638/g.84663 Transcript_38638/m.84663 type:complete len:212 (-) Transcript_38638:1198-1833(-)